VKRQKENREIIPAIKDHNGTIITDTTGKANILNYYYAYIFCCNHNIPKIQSANSGETFITNAKVIRKKLPKTGRNESVEPDGVPGKILKLGGEAMTPYLARLLEISLYNATIPSDWKNAITNYRPISLTSVVCKQLEHIIAGYLR
jgi:hypothetical protein